MLALWTKSPETLIKELDSTSVGLTSIEASKRVSPPVKGPYVLWQDVKLFLTQFRSPIIMILVAAAILSSFLGDASDAIIIVSIVLISGVLGFWHEHHATRAVGKLLEMVRIKSTVLRDGSEVDVFYEEVVQGDIVVLNGGDKVPGDCLIIESRDLFVNESSMTGESFPAEKAAGISAQDAVMTAQHNVLFLGTHVVSGTAKAIVASVGAATQFGQLVHRLSLQAPDNDFEVGVRKFGNFLMKLTIILAVSIFFVNIYFDRTLIEALMFSIALAVGLTPQLLPAIITINLSHGARRMALFKVIVKRLNSIENIGSMDILCTDKTGTLTQGEIRLSNATDISGAESVKTHLYGHLNALFSTGYSNPIDDAMKIAPPAKVALNYGKLDEIPYDFQRRRVSILVENSSKTENTMITKGAVRDMVNICAFSENANGDLTAFTETWPHIEQAQLSFGKQGFRTIAVAYKSISSTRLISKLDEMGMTFLGLLSFNDPPKEGIAQTLNELRNNGVQVKIITGDSLAISSYVAKQIGLSEPKTMTGTELVNINEEALALTASSIDLFCEIEPQQKEKIVIALKKAGHVVGYLGDGINDAAALHAADVGISVNNAVDIAKEAADLVLLEKDLSILVEGVREGRRTFANTIKYVFMATSANVGNMLSMAGSSFFLPFLPLLPKQILITNLFTDFPEMAIATDRVDDEALLTPTRWDLPFIKRFMLVFGLISSFYDFLTFFILMRMKLPVEQFRTGWLTESIFSAAMVVLVIRTRHPFYKSPPGRYLIAATLFILVATLVLPTTPIAPALGLAPMPTAFWPWLFGILVFYAISAEVAKVFFYRNVKTQLHKISVPTK